MRMLFESEKRIISTLGRQKWNVDLPTDLCVLVEQHIECHSNIRPLFNLDFRLDFAEDPAPTDFLSVVECALPNAMGGADVFLAVDRDCQAPLSLQLILGDAFPQRFFKEYIEQVEYLLQSNSVLSALEESEIDQKAHKNALRVNNSLYCRMFVIGNEICFLLLLSDERPNLYGTKRTLISDEALGDVCCHIHEGRVVIIDGWIIGEEIRQA